MSKGTMLSVYRLLILIITIYVSNAQETCYTPSNRTGTCINIYNCKPLLDVLKSRPLTTELANALRQLHCGFEGESTKVCCIQQTSVTVTEAPPPTDAIPNPPDVSNHPNLRLINEDICGPVTQSKIFGGNKTQIFEFPWMALLAYRTSDAEPVFLCGGTLINKRYVLTAAHCVTALPSGRTLIGVRLGEHDLATEVDCDRDSNGLQIVCAERYQDFELDSVHYHPDYPVSKPWNDIALLRLKTEADLRPANVRPICLPIGQSAALKRKTVKVTGWGATELGVRSMDLLKVSLPVVTNEKCTQVYDKITEIWYKQICAGGVKLMDSCGGDSGGPLQAPGVYKNNVKYIQYGLVSFGPKICGTPGFPGVYTRITYYMDWILNTIKP